MRHPNQPQSLPPVRQEAAQHPLQWADPTGLAGVGVRMHHHPPGLPILLRHPRHQPLSPPR